MRFQDLGRLGISGVVGAGLVLFSLSYYLGTIAAEEEELQNLQREEAKLSAILSASADQTRSPRETTATLPPLSAAPELIGRLHETAEKFGLAIDHISYQLATDGGSQRYEISLPLRGPYPSLRHFLGEALTLSPGVVMSGIHLSRRNATEPTVEASAQLAFYFTAP